MTVSGPRAVSRSVVAGIVCIACLTVSRTVVSQAQPAVFATTASGHLAQPNTLDVRRVPPIPAEITARIAAIHDLPSSQFVDWLPDGGIIVSKRKSGPRQLYRIPSPGSDPIAISNFDQPVARALFNPEDESLLLLMDDDGDEDFQILRSDLDGEILDARTPEGTRASSIRLSPSGTRIAFSQAFHPEHPWGILTNNLKTNETRVVFQDQGAWVPVDWSTDETTLLILEYQSIDQSRLALVDVETGIRVPIGPPLSSGGFRQAKFAADSRFIFWTGNHNREFVSLYRYDRKTGTATAMLDGISGDVDQFFLSQDGQRLVAVMNVEGVAALFGIDLKTDTRRTFDLPPMSVVGPSGFSPDGNQFAFTAEQLTARPQVFSFGWDGGELTRWTNPEDESVAARERPIVSSAFRYLSFPDQDGKREDIHAFLHHPEGKGPFPVVIHIHGGPEAQSRPGHSIIYRHLIGDLGVAVVTPNIRGSTGYGRRFTHLDDGPLRQNSISDVVALLEWIEKDPRLDETRVVIRGGSYGGYVALATAIRVPERVKGVISSVGIANFVTFLEQTKPYRQDLRRIEYGDERNPRMRQFLTRISPLTNARRLRSPLMVIHGANDPRVPISEARALISAVEEEGGKPWTIFAENEGHGFKRRANRLFQFSAAHMFIERLISNTDQPQG
ncbi:MAG: alpha/beta fold hydrolase [Pseudomonadota bacterium]